MEILELGNAVKENAKLAWAVCCAGVAHQERGFPSIDQFVLEIAFCDRYGLFCPARGGYMRTPTTNVADKGIEVINVDVKNEKAEVIGFHPKLLQAADVFVFARFLNESQVELMGYLSQIKATKRCRLATMTCSRGNTHRMATIERKHIKTMPQFEHKLNVYRKTMFNELYDSFSDDLQRWKDGSDHESGF